MSADMQRDPEPLQENVLAQALQRLAAGESPEAILAGAGPDVDWLAPLLAVAAAVRDMREAVPVPPADGSLARFLAEAGSLAVAGPAEPAWRRAWRRLVDALHFPIPGPRLVSPLVSAALAFMVVVLAGALYLGTPAAAAARGILPGQPLYALKRAGEELYLRLPLTGAGRDAMAAQYAERRRDEVRQLLDRRLEARVAFRGKVERLEAGAVVVDGLTARLTGDTRIQGLLAVGAQVRVEARTTGGQGLAADRIVVEVPAPPTPAPSLTATPSPTPAPSPTGTATGAPSPTPRPTATRTPASAVEPAVATQEPARGAQDEVEDNANANTNEDGANENANEDRGGDGNDNSGGDDEGGGDDNSGNDNSGDGGDNSGNDNSGDGGDNSGDGGEDNDNGGDDSSGSGGGGDDGGGDNDNGADDSGGSGGDADDEDGDGRS
jgi:uncharacterized membrane protein YgcG